MVFTRTLFSVCLLSTSLFFVAVALLVRSVPALVELSSRAIRFLLRWSYRLYYRIFLLLEPRANGQLGISLMEMPFRMMLALLFSIFLGCLITLILHRHITWVTIVVSGLHGITVAWLWKDFFEPQGLHIGEEK